MELCDHEVCNRPDARGLTTQEVEQILACLLERGLLERTENGRYRIVGGDGDA